MNLERTHQLAEQYGNRYHPSFLPLVQGVRERGPYSPHAYIQYTLNSDWDPKRDKFNEHTHMVKLGYSDQNFLVNKHSVEDAAEELVDVISSCPSNHVFEEREVAESAIYQLNYKDFDRERAHAVWLQAMYAKWGGHIPAAVILPTEAEFKEWQVIVPDHRGDLQFAKVRNGFLENMVPPPTDRNSERAPGGLGYYHKNMTGEQWFRIKRKLAERQAKTYNRK